MSNKKFSDTSIPLNLKNKSEEIKKMFVKVANESYDKGMSITQSIAKANQVVLDFEKEQLKKSAKPATSVEDRLKQTIKKRLEESNSYSFIEDADDEIVEVEKATLDEQLSDDIVSADFDEYGRLIITLESGKRIISKKPRYKEQQVEQNIVVTNDYRPFLEMQEPTGFKTRTTSQLNFNDATRTFTISAKEPATEFNVWLHAREFTRESESVQIPDISGIHFFYFDYPDNELKTTMIPTSDLFLNTALVALVYWRADQQRSIYFADERHGIVMDGATHQHLHLSIGAQYRSGLGLYNFQADQNGSLDSHAQFACENGIIADEDLTINILDGLPQELAPIANIPVFYRIGSSASPWYKKNANGFPLIMPGQVTHYPTGSRPCYNHLVGNEWQVAEVPNNQFLLVHVLATNDINHPIIAILGNTYNTKSAARDAIQNEIGSLTNLPVLEFVKLGSIIYECADSYTNSVKSRVTTIDGTLPYYDFRQTFFTFVRF